jgi:hypothetical protein
MPPKFSLKTRGERIKFARDRRRKAIDMGKSLDKRISTVLNRKAEKKYSLSTNINGGYTVSQDIGRVTDSYFACSTDTIAVGANDNNNRVGDQIRLQKLHLRFTVQASQAAATGNDNNLIRCIIVKVNELLDTGANVGSTLNGIYPALNFMMIGGGSVLHVTSPYNHDRKKAKLFNILYDKTVSLNNAPVNATQSNTSIRYFNINLNLKDSIVQYVSNSTTNAKGHILCLVISNNVAAVINPPKIFNACKLLYTDI